MTVQFEESVAHEVPSVTVVIVGVVKIKSPIAYRSVIVIFNFTSSAVLDDQAEYMVRDVAQEFYS
jgi:hypothetical protein